MIVTKNIKDIITFPIIIIMCIGFISCDLEVNETETFLFKNEALNKRVQVNIEEAKIVSNISVINETLIVLSELTDKSNNKYQIKSLLKNIKKDNLKIKNNLNVIAEKKLILLPTKIDEDEINDLSKINKEKFAKAHLSKIKKLLESEITQLEYLSTITNDVDFKVLTVKTLVKLNYNLDQTQKILKTNY